METLNDRSDTDTLLLNSHVIAFPQSYLLRHTMDIFHYHQILGLGLLLGLVLTHPSEAVTERRSPGCAGQGRTIRHLSISLMHSSDHAT